MSWKNILKKLTDYEEAVADEFADDEDMEKPDYSNTGPFANMPEFPSLRRKKITTKDSTGQDEDAAERTKQDEAKLLAEIEERNKKARGN
jgi:hypothetical protein